MKKIWTKIVKWWYFTIRNNVIRKGESGGFKWKFRRFWLEIETISGNFKARFTAGEHPYGYLISGDGDENIHGFALTMYEIGMLLTTDQGLVNDVQRALKKYEKRLEKEVNVDDAEEKVAIEEVKAVQAHIDLPKKERRKADREIDKKFKKTVEKSLNGKD